MRFIGFLKSNDKNIDAGKNIEEMFVEEDYNEEYRAQVIEYLKNGVWLVAIMTMSKDEFDGQFIGDGSIYTDGEYIWPAYYIGYLSKYKNFYIYPDFYEHIMRNKFIIPDISKSERIKICDIFIAHWQKKIK